MIKNDSEISGFFDFKILYDQIAEQIPNGSRFAEVGVFRGASLCYLASKVKELGKTNCQFYAIDIWKGRSDQNIFFANCIEYGVAEMIRPIRALSSIALLHFPANYLFSVMIDGDHRENQTVKDVKMSLHRTTDIVCGHDIHLPSVRRAVDKTIGEGNYDIIGNCWIYRKM